MNTRLQVEHPVTEMITGLDLVEWQLRVASGEPLPLAQAQIPRRGHAVEARLYAEDPERGFLPSTGRLARLRFPTAPRPCVSTPAWKRATRSPVHYDPMIAKVIVWAPDRAARSRSCSRRSRPPRSRACAPTRGSCGRSSARQPCALATSARACWRPTRARPRHRAAEITEAWLIAAAARLHAPARRRAARRIARSPWEPRRLPPERTCKRARRAAPQTKGAPAAVAASRAPAALACVPARADASPSCSTARASAGLASIAPARSTAASTASRSHARVETTTTGCVVRRHCLRFDFVEDTGAEHRVSAEHEGHFRAPMPGMCWTSGRRGGRSRRARCCWCSRP